jgi:hypothetical protein
MAIIGTMQFHGGSGQVPINQPVDITLILTNTGTSAVNVRTLQPFATSNSQPYSGAIFGVPTSTGGVLAIPANGGQLCFSCAVVFQSPNGSAETGTALASVSTTGVLVGFTTYTDDNAVTSVSQTVTPAQLGATAPVAGALRYDSPLSLAYLYW